jgi:hypothetical protein
MRCRIAALAVAFGLIPQMAPAASILLGQLQVESKGTADGTAFSAPFFLAYYPLLDPTSHEEIMLGKPFVPAGFHGHFDFEPPEIDPVVARLKDHVEERLGGSTIGLIFFPNETSPYWGTDAIRDTWEVDHIRLLVKRITITNHLTDFDYDIAFRWQIFGEGLQAPSAIPEPSLVVLLGVGAIGVWRRLGRRSAGDRSAA